MVQLDPEGIAAVCVCYLDRRSPGSMRYAVKRLRRKLPDVDVLVGIWGEMDPNDVDRLRRNTDVKVVTNSIEQTVQVVRDLATQEAERGEGQESALRNDGTAFIESPVGTAAG